MDLQGEGGTTVSKLVMWQKQESKLMCVIIICVLLYWTSDKLSQIGGLLVGDNTRGILAALLTTNLYVFNDNHLNISFLLGRDNLVLHQIKFLSINSFAYLEYDIKWCCSSSGCFLALFCRGGLAHIWNDLHPEPTSQVPFL